MFNRFFLLAFSFLTFTSLNAQDFWTDLNSDTDFAYVRPNQYTMELEVEEIIAEIPSVVLEKFESSSMGTSTILNWESQKEHNNAFFLLQRSDDEGKTYNTIAELKAANTPCEYFHIDDTEQTQLTQYRLAQVNTAGNVYFFTEL